MAGTPAGGVGLQAASAGIDGACADAGRQQLRALGQRNNDVLDADPLLHASAQRRMAANAGSWAGAEEEEEEGAPPLAAAAAVAARAGTRGAGGETSAVHTPGSLVERLQRRLYASNKKLDNASAKSQASDLAAARHEERDGRGADVSGLQGDLDNVNAELAPQADAPQAPLAAHAARAAPAAGAAPAPDDDWVHGNTVAQALLRLATSREAWQDICNIVILAAGLLWLCLNLHRIA